MIEIFNKCPNVESFSVAGMGLNSVQSSRLLFVWKINSKLIHPGSEALGIGLKYLYFGNGCSIPISFLRSLSESAPNISRFHLDAGASLSLDPSTTNGNGNSRFDLKEFVRSFPNLSSFTFIGNNELPCRNGLDDILNICHHLETLHVRGDHITFDFFRSILAFNLPLEDPFDNSSHPISSPSQRFKLRHLRISHTVPLVTSTPNQRDFITLDGSKILSFSRSCLEIESRGISWPNVWEDSGSLSSKDLLMRAIWMMESVERKKNSKINNSGLIESEIKPRVPTPRLDEESSSSDDSEEDE
jgi:hypothetical protein